MTSFVAALGRFVFIYSKPWLPTADSVTLSKTAI